MDNRFMGDLAEKIDDEFEKEYAELSEIGKSFAPTLDAKLTETASFYDKKYAAVKKKSMNLRMLKKAAVFLLVFVSVNAVAIGTSEGYRQFAFQIFENEENNSITFHKQIEQDILREWEDYWYPSQMPDGYKITAAEESPQKCILINNGQKELLITEYAAGTVLSYDTKHSQMSDIRINASVGKLISFESQKMIVYPTENMILEFTFDSDIPEADVIAIAENMEYVQMK